MKPARFLPLAFLFPGLLRAAQEPLDLTLGEALQRAAAQNVEALAADQRVNQALARLDPARGTLLPQLSVQGSANRQTRNLEAQGFTLPGMPAVIGPYNTYDARLKLSQTLLDAAAFRRLESARRGRALAEADRVRARQDVLALAATDYVEARRSEETLALAGDALSLAKAKAALAGERASAGTATPLDAEEASQAEVSAEAALIEATLARDRSLRDLLGTLALPEGTGLRFGEEALPPEKAGAPARPDAAVAEAQREARRAEAAAARGEYFPKLSLSADNGYIGKGTSDLKNTYTLGAQASWALFDGGQRRGRRLDLESQAAEAAARADDADRRTASTLAQAEESASAARQLLAAREAEERLAARREALARERRAAGAASEMDVLDAAYARARARDMTRDAAALLWTAEIARRRALGRMEELIR